MQIIPLQIICTSCDRFDLLEKTLDSFFLLNKYPYISFDVHNDSIISVPYELKLKYKKYGIIWHEGIKRGLSASWDYLVSLVKTEYFFNIEDDWLFNGNPDFIQESIDLLQSFDQVWIRDLSDHKQKYQSINDSKIVNIVPTKDWCGFTFNPSVRILSKWKTWFPNGISGLDEIEISRKLMGNYNACSLKNGACKHIGWNRHSKDFKI